MKLFAQDKKNIPFPQKLALLLLGLFLSVLILESALRLGAFFVLSQQELRNRISLGQPAAYRIMCLGESTTQGQYPRFLEAILNRRVLFRIDFSVIDKGLAACNTSMIVSQLEKNIARYRPDMVVAMMGINDAGKHMLYKSLPSSGAGKFLSHFKSYYLLKWIWLNVISKIQEMGKGEKYFMRQGWENINLNNPAGAGVSFKKAIARCPSDSDAFFALGHCYYLEGNFTEAEKNLNRALRLNAKNDRAFSGLGNMYLALTHIENNQARSFQAERVFNRALEINPHNKSALLGLGWIYFDRGLLEKAAGFFKKAAELDPNDRSAMAQLIQIKYKQNRYPEAKDIIDRAVDKNPNSEALCRIASRLFDDMGEKALAESYREKAEGLALKEFSPVTRDNYLKLLRIVEARGIRLVCVQYPMRSVDSLKRLLGDQHGIIFVDNDEIFREAVRREGYEEYFTDRFAGDFGHCAHKGNKLLAGNIAKAILEGVFQR